MDCITVQVLSWSEVRARDFGAIDGTTLDATAWQCLVDKLPAKGGKIILPAGNFPCPGFSGVRDGTIIEGVGDATVLERTSANQVMFCVGSNPTQNDRIKGVKFRDFRIDGKSYSDTSDDFPHIQFKYVEGGLLDGVNAVNGSTLVRLGNGNSTWSLSAQRSRKIEIRNFLAENMAYFGVEAFGYEDCHIHHGRIIGGDRSTSSVCAGVRSVKGSDNQWDHLVIDGMGKGILATGGTEDEQPRISFDNIDIRNPSYGYCIDISSPTREWTLRGIKARGRGPNNVRVAYISGEHVQNTFEDCTFEALDTETTDTLRVNDGTDLSLKGCNFRNRFTTSSASTFGCRLVGQAGVTFIGGCLFDMSRNEAGAVGLANVSPSSGNIATVTGSTFIRGGALAAQRSGTLIVGGSLDITR